MPVANILAGDENSTNDASILLGVHFAGRRLNGCQPWTGDVAAKQQSANKPSLMVKNTRGEVMALVV
jgi:hypothetical protein